jgi:hypothetical protein
VGGHEILVKHEVSQLSCMFWTVLSSSKNAQSSTEFNCEISLV